MLRNCSRSFGLQTCWMLWNCSRGPIAYLFMGIRPTSCCRNHAGWTILLQPNGRPGWLASAGSLMGPGALAMSNLLNGEMKAHNIYTSNTVDSFRNFEKSVLEIKRFRRLFQRGENQTGKFEAEGLEPEGKQIGGWTVRLLLTLRCGGGKGVMAGWNRRTYGLMLISEMAPCPRFLWGAAMPHLPRAWEARVLLRLLQAEGEDAAVGALALPSPGRALTRVCHLGRRAGLRYVPCSL